MRSIEQRCNQRITTAFVARSTVDPLGQQMIGIIADRRMTMMHRYLDKAGDPPNLHPGLRVWHGGLGPAITVRAGHSAGIALASTRRPFERIGFGVDQDDATESQMYEQYHYPEKNRQGQRRNITLVALNGWPGSPCADDSIRVEQWNDYGVGQETIIAFDDLNPLQELVWDVKGDRGRHVHLDDEWCVTHGAHFESAQHKHLAIRAARTATLAEHLITCLPRTATLAENLRLLAELAESKEGS